MKNVHTEDSYKNRPIIKKSDLVGLMYGLPTIPYLFFSITLTGQIRTRKELEAFILECPYSDQSRSLKDRSTGWENFKKNQPQQILNIDDIKNILEFKGNGKLRDALKFCCLIQKRYGRKYRIEGTPLIYTQQHEQDIKTRYQPSWDITKEKMKEVIPEIIKLLDSLSDINKRKVEKAFCKACH